jgi:hypothetical protein
MLLPLFELMMQLGYELVSGTCGSPNCSRSAIPDQRCTASGTQHDSDHLLVPEQEDFHVPPDRRRDLRNLV